MSFWKRIIKSFEPNFYKEAAFWPIREAVKYLFLLVLIVSLVLSVYYVSTLRNAAIEFLDKNKEDLPKLIQDVVVPITIEDGEVFAEVEQLYIKTFGDEDPSKFVFIIDTTGQITSLEDYEAGLLLTKNSVVVQNQNQGTTEIKKYDLSKVKNFSIRPTEADDEYLILSNNDKDFHVTYGLLIRWIKKLSLVAWPVLIVFLYVFGVFGKFVQVFIFSLFLLILNATFSKRLNYPNLFNISVFAITIPTALAVLHIISGFNFKYFSWIYILVYISYLSVGFIFAKEKFFVEENTQSK